MAENQASKKLPSRIYHLTDDEYFNYFKNQTNRDAVYDEFGKEFDQINVNDFTGIIHHNCLQVITYMIQRRSGYAKETQRLCQQIQILEREKADAIKSLTAENKENQIKQQRIKQLESLWTGEKANLDSQIAELKGEAETWRKDAKRYRNERNTAEHELKKKNKKYQELNEQIQNLKEKNIQLEADLNATNYQIKDLDTQLEQMNFFQNEINELKQAFNAKDSELKNVQRQFESAKKELKEKKEEIETLNKKNAELDADLNDAKKQINELQTQRDQLNKDFEIQDDELKIVQTQFNEFKEKCKHLEESAAIERSQMTQIEVEQLQQALECSQKQSEKYQKEIDKIRKENIETAERKSAALKVLTESVKNVIEKTSCKRAQKTKSATAESSAEKLKFMEEETQTSKNMIAEQQNIINRISADYSNLFDDNRKLRGVIGQLNSELAEAKKRRQRNDKAVEKRQLSKEQKQQLQSGNNDIGEGSSSKRARHDIHQHPALSFNLFAPTGQQLIQGPISSSPPTLTPPPNRTPQLPVHAQPSNIGTVNVQPNAFPFLKDQLNQGFGLSTMHLSPNFYNFPPRLQQLLHQDMMIRGFNGSHPNVPPPSNSTMTLTNNSNDNHQQPTQQLPSPNGTLEMMPPVMPQQHHQMSPEQLNAFKQWQQEQLRLQQQVPAMLPPAQQQPPPFQYSQHSRPPPNQQQ